MGNWRNAFPSQYLKAADFPKPRLLTIKKFGEEEIGGEPKPALWFREETKALILNRVNGDMIERITGSAETDDWVGKAIVCFATTTEFQGRNVDCIRVRAPKPGAIPPPPPAEEFHPADEDVPFSLVGLLPFLAPAVLLVRGLLA